MALERYRLQSLKEYFKDYLNKYKSSLLQSKKKPDKAWLALWHNYNEKYSEQLLSAYLQKCKMFFKLAFLQFRGKRVGADLAGLEEIFKSTKKRMGEIVDICSDIDKYDHPPSEEEKVKFLEER